MLEPLTLTWLFIGTLALAVVALEILRSRDDRARNALEATRTPENIAEGPVPDEGEIAASELLRPDLGPIIETLRTTARNLAGEGREITSDDLHEVVPIPAGVDPRIMGTAFHPRADWQRTGWRPSRRAVNNRRMVSVWRLKSPPPADRPRPS